MTYATVARRWPESTIACVASGPSLTAEDCQYLRGRARVVAVNDGIRLTEGFADVLYSSDYRWWNYYHGMPSYAGPKYAVEIRMRSGRQNYERLPMVSLLRWTGGSGLETAPDGLRTILNSGGAAINLAVHLGARRILLLGYNMGPIGRRHNFIRKPSEIQVVSQYEQWRQAFETMVEPLAAAGVEVVNCTPQTALTCFPCVPLRDALPDTATIAPEEAVA